MIDSADFLSLPYTRDLTEGGIAYALRSLPYSSHRAKGSPYDRLRRLVASAAVDLAFRRYLSEQKIPFAVKSALPFTKRDHYDVTLAGRRCEVRTFLISHSEQVLQIQRNPKLLLHVPALVASDQHAAEGHSPRDLYLFAFLTGRVTATQQELKNIAEAQQPYPLVHVMPDAWNRPARWSPLGKLVLKSESEEMQMIEIAGQDEGRTRRSITVKLPPRTRLEVGNDLFSVSYLRINSASPARIGIHSSVRRVTHLINADDWGNLWVEGLDLWLTGYITREEFNRRASFLPAGSRVFQYNATQVKSLVIPVSDLRALSELFERTKMVSPLTAA